MRLAAAIAITCAAIVAPMRCVPAPHTCDQYLPEIIANAPEHGWDAGRMSRIMWRESRCQPDAWNARGRASGLLQIVPVNYAYLERALGEHVDRWTLTDPVQNIRAAAALFEWWSQYGSGYRPWSL